MARQVVGDAKEAASCGGWIQIARVVGGEDEWARGEGSGPIGSEGVKDLKKGKTDQADEVKPDRANLHGTVGPGF